MLCEVCHKKKATVHYTEIVKNQMIKYNLCESCAKDKGITIYAKFSIADLLSGLAEFEGRQTGLEDKKCRTCGMSYQEFKEVGRFGCALCYVEFDDLLKSLLESIHKSTRHIGKFPKRWAKQAATEVELKELEDSLHKAVAAEAFEEAARIRDRIKEIKNAGAK